MTETPDRLARPSPLIRMEEWLAGASFPLWGSVGWDPASELFLERLDAAGRPLPDIPRRLMVQARQIFAFTIAAQRGWYAAGDRLERAVNSMVRLYHERDGSPGWIFSVNRHGEPIETRRDLYGLAFVLLALARSAESLGPRRARALADDTLAFLDRHMAHPLGGYVDALPQPADRRLRQNPHMHLLEALLALHEAAPDGDYLDRARTLVALLRGRILQGKPPVLAEFFEPDWTPRGGADIPFEPGHHFEWAWLLTRFGQLGGDPMPDLAASLWSTAATIGIGPDGRIVDEASLGRGTLNHSTRLWPYAEAAKAACCVPPGPPNQTADSFLDGLRARFLDPAPAGSWIDHLDPEGRALTGFAPASSLYHIVCAVDVVADHAGRGAGQSEREDGAQP